MQPSGIPRVLLYYEDGLDFPFQSTLFGWSSFPVLRDLHTYAYVWNWSSLDWSLPGLVCITYSYHSYGISCSSPGISIFLYNLQHIFLFALPCQKQTSGSWSWQATSLSSTKTSSWSGVLAKTVTKAGRLARRLLP